MWAPSARAVSVVGDSPTRGMGACTRCARWARAGSGNRSSSTSASGARSTSPRPRRSPAIIALGADPFAFDVERPPETASVVNRPHHVWRDADWVAERRERDPLGEPISIYEVHLVLAAGSRSGTRRRPTASSARARGLSHRARLHARRVVARQGPTFQRLWGTRRTVLLAPTPRHGSPDDLRELIDRLHAAGIGVILDWVPAHFPATRTAWPTSTAPRSMSTPTRGRAVHPDWDATASTTVATRSATFLGSRALCLAREHHADGLRVDAVASMLYLDYSRNAGEWIPNQHGGRENLGAIAFLRAINARCYTRAIRARRPSPRRPRGPMGLAPDLRWRARVRLE